MIKRSRTIATTNDREASARHRRMRHDATSSGDCTNNLWHECGKGSALEQCSKRRHMIRQPKRCLASRLSPACDQSQNFAWHRPPEALANLAPLPRSSSAMNADVAGLSCVMTCKKAPKSIIGSSQSMSKRPYLLYHVVGMWGNYSFPHVPVKFQCQLLKLFSDTWTTATRLSFLPWQPHCLPSPWRSAPEQWFYQADLRSTRYELTR